MKRILPFLVGLTVLAFAVPEESTTTAFEEVTITGKLIDTKCYGMNHDNHENDHMGPGKDGKMMKLPNCATACAAMGIPVGILEGGKKDGDVYVLITPALGLAQHQAKEARVTGMPVFEGGIIPTKIEVKENDKWVDVTPGGMM